VRVVLDTNVLLSGLMAPGGAPGRIVAAWRGGHFDLVLSDSMLEEIQRTLTYPKVQTRIGWNAEEIAHFILLLRLESETVEIGDVEAHVPVDPDDTPVLATLLASGAEVLVTGDKDLLALADDHPIVTPAAFARRL